MSDNSAIEWTNSTWNPVTGCTKVTSGCDHCYAERFSERFRGVVGHPYEPGFDLTLRPERLDNPKRWRRSRLIFVNSMSDLFHKDIPEDYIGRVFDTMETADQHVYQVLTKRSSLMRNFVNRRYIDQAAPSHIWLGVSIENASTMSRLRHLKQTNASIRFVSFEPLLGPLGAVDLSDIHWVIAGGESGPGARPPELNWLREIRDCCQDQAVPFFFKQWGGRTPKHGGNNLDGRKWLEYPKNRFKERDRQSVQVAGAPFGEDGSAAPMEVGPWAQEKLKCLRKYLSAYTTIMRKQRWVEGYFYIDAFAGPGTLKVRKKQVTDSVRIQFHRFYGQVLGDSETAEYISGSPRIALELKHPFTDYVFIEIDDGRYQQLQALKAEFEKRRDVTVQIEKQDCNSYLCGLASDTQINWKKWRGIVFLDPFGMQVPWNTLARLAKTNAIEILINFPVGMAIQRLLKKSGKFSQPEREKLNEYFGTEEWYEELYGEFKGFFGTVVYKNRPSGDVLVKWYRKRLKKLFKYVTHAREVQNSKGSPLYYLIHAGQNSTGNKIAGEILKQGARMVR